MARHGLVGSGTARFGEARFHTPHTKETAMEEKQRKEPKAAIYDHDFIGARLRELEYQKALDRAAIDAKLDREEIKTTAPAPPKAVPPNRPDPVVLVAVPSKGRRKTSSCYWCGDAGWMPHNGLWRECVYCKNPRLYPKPKSGP